jgi:hypothetical protein
MTTDGSGELAELAAGSFSSWLSAMEGALRGERSSDVACGGCTGCCTSAQFVHIGPDEIEKVYERLIGRPLARRDDRVVAAMSSGATEVVQ